MKKLFTILFISIFLLSFASALNFDNVKRFDDSVGEYGKITIDNLFGLGDTIEEITLKENTDVCGSECSAIKEITLHQRGKLVDSVIFETIKEDGSRIEQPIRNYQFYIQTSQKEIEVDDYETICEIKGYSINSSAIQECSNVKVGSHIEYTPEWTPYNFEEVEAGDYILKLEGEKRPDRTVDWIITSQGKEIREWAVWSGSNNIGNGLVAYYNADELSGNTLNDYFSISNLTGDSTSNSVGKVNLSHNYTISQTNAGNLKNLSIGNHDRSVGFWVYPTSYSSGISITMGTDGNGLKWNILISSTSFTSDLGGNSKSYSTTTNVGNWYYINYIYTTDGKVQFWKNGLNIANVTHDITSSLSSNYTIINNYNFNNNGMAGRYDEIAFWDRSLTESEITTLYNSGNGLAYPFGGSVVLNSPANSYTSPSNSVTFNTTINQPLANLTNASLYLDGVLNETNIISGNTNTTTWTKSLPDGTYNWSVQACDIDGDCGFSENRTLTIDTGAPLITINYPTSAINYGYNGKNETFNVTIEDDALNTCWYEYNNVNSTFSCLSGVERSVGVIINNSKNINFYANDTVGNMANSSLDFEYLLFKSSESYNSMTFEGITNDFSINFLTNGTNINSASLIYNNSVNSASISNHGSNNFTVSASATSPTVSADTNVSFFWNITQSSITQNVSYNNQSVRNLVIDDCSSQPVVFYNFTIKDEELLTQIANTTASLELDVYNADSGNIIGSYNKTYSNNPFTICLSTNLSEGEEFAHDLQLQYSGGGYEQEFYNVQNQTINSTSLPLKINLLDLNSSDSQVFKIIFRDTSFLPVEDALIKIYRKYIGLNEYKITEIPLTDAKGETVAHLVINNVIYKIEVVKQNVQLAEFNDVVAVCQNPLIQTCTIDLNAFAESIELPDYQTKGDFAFTLDYNETNREIVSQFDIPSNEVRNITLVVIKNDALGETVCSDTLTSSSGTLTCTVPSSFGNSTVSAKIFDNTELKAQGSINLDQGASDIYGVILVTISLFVMMTLLGAGLSDNPVFTVIFLMVGVLLLFALNLVSNNGFIGATATILWLVIAVIIVVIKGAKRN